MLRPLVALALLLPLVPVASAGPPCDVDTEFGATYDRVTVTCGSVVEASVCIPYGPGNPCEALLEPFIPVP